MAYQRVPETAEIIVHFAVDDANFVNTYHAQKPGGYNSSHLESLAALVDANAVPILLAKLSANVLYVKTVVRGLDAENDIVREDNTNTGFGTVGVNLLPVNVAFCVQRLSGLSGQTARGRVYIGGIPNTYLQTGAGNQNKLLSTAVTDYINAVDTFRTVIETGGIFNAVIVSRYHNGAKRAEGVVTRWISTQVSDDRVDTQRRRVNAD